MTVQNRNDLFTPERIAGMINKVSGYSSIAELSQQRPMAFNGNEIFAFSMDNEIDIVAESGAKSQGGATITKVQMRPIKVEYSARFSDEMWYSSEEAQLDIVKEFMEGYAKKLARGLDLMAFHGVNPRGQEPSTEIGDNHFDKKVEQTVEYNAEKIDDAIEDAIFLVTGSGGVNTGIAMSHTVGRDLSKIGADRGVRDFPEFRMGNRPTMFAGAKNSINGTVSEVGETEVYVGDFENSLRWGYSKHMGLELHTAGDPDNSQKDLAGHNQVLLRSETYLGWGILVPENFARVVKSVGEGD